MKLPCQASLGISGLGIVPMILALLSAALFWACAEASEPVKVEVTREVPVEATRIVTEEVEVTREVPVEVPVEVTRVVPRAVEVSREVPVEVPVEVTRVVPREVEVTRVVRVEVPVEVTRVVLREVEVTRVVRVEVPVEVTRVVPRQVVVEPTATPRPTPIPPSASPHPSGRLAYMSKVHGNYDIFVVNGDGSERRRLTYGPENEFVYDWSPDGRQLVFREENGYVYTMNHDGSERRRLETGDNNKVGRNMAWSPSGKQIAFASKRARVADDKNWDIFVMRSGGDSRPRRLTQGHYARWSPSGGKLVFQDASGIYVIDADGSDRRRLTNRTGLLPDWSPDGRTIAFAGLQDDNWDIFTVGLDGSGERRLTSGAGIELRPSSQSTLMLKVIQETG